LLLVLVAGAFVIYKYKGSEGNTMTPPIKNTDEKAIDDEATGRMDFEEIEETKDTPEEINNEVLDELDSLIMDAEKSAPSGDLSDLEQ
jgi:RecA/RadA recombinase